MSSLSGEASDTNPLENQSFRTVEFRTPGRTEGTFLFLVKLPTQSLQKNSFFFLFKEPELRTQRLSRETGTQDPKKN